MYTKFDAKRFNSFQFTLYNGSKHSLIIYIHRGHLKVCITLRIFPEQLTEIKKIKLSRVLCDNSDNIVTIQPFALELPSQQKYVLFFLNIFLISICFGCN